jgi:hypothetical protein
MMDAKKQAARLGLVNALYQRAAALATLEVEEWRPARDLYKRLDEMLNRLAVVDMKFWPIQERVLRSRSHISHVKEQVMETKGQHVDFVRIEVINALWWEIRALEILRKYPRKKRGTIGKNQKHLRALLEERPDASAHDAFRYLNEKESWP